MSIVKGGLSMFKHTQTRMLLALLLIFSGMVFPVNTTAENVQIWDTLSPVLDAVDVREKTDWNILPTGTGRKYRPKGDIVVGNAYLTAVFCSKSGKVVIYSKSEKKRMEFVPLQLKAKPANIISCKIVQNTDDRAIVEVCFSAENMKERLSAIFSFGSKEIIEVKPAENMRGISLLSPIEYAIVPAFFIGDDLIYAPQDYSSLERLHIPSQNLFLGLLRGEYSMLVITWPEGKQEISLVTDNKKGKGHLFESIDFKNAGKSIYLAILDAPGIWHKEALKSSYLEKDVAIDWLRPFPAKWVTQLKEDDVKTTFRFQEFKPERFWRGGVGSYIYPVWFETEPPFYFARVRGKPFYHLSKRVPPEGNSIIYFVEPNKRTLPSISTPADIMKQTLGVQIYERIVDTEGRKIRAAHRPFLVCERATCEVTGRLKSIFEAGEEVEERAYIEGGIEDMLSHLVILTERVNAYQDFAREMITFLTSMKQDKPQSKPFLNEMENITKEMITAYDLAKENLKSVKYAQQLGVSTRALTKKKSPDNLPAFLELRSQWTGMGGALESLNRKLNTIARKLFQQAGYSCVRQPEQVKIAEEIRKQTRKFLRNPNEYEMWPNY